VFDSPTRAILGVQEGERIGISCERREYDGVLERLVQEPTGTPISVHIRHERTNVVTVLPWHAIEAVRPL
jgi:hypothetical protein